MASLKFHKVSSLPASCALGDVYYVVGKGIYVCTTAASSGATESANYTRFSYANDAASGVKGVTSLSDSVSTTSSAIAATSTAVKSAYDRGSKGVSDAANALSVANSKWAQKTATQASGGTAVEGTVIGYYTSTSGFSKSPIIDGVVYYKDTNTHNKHGHTFKANAAATTTSTATSVDVVSALNAATATDGNLSSTYDMVKVPTLKVTNDLASEIANLKTVNTTGMQYKGTRTDGTVPAAGKVGDVYKVTTKAISGVGAEVGDFIVCNTTTTSATNSAWDVWQANVNKDAYWDTNTPVSGNFVVADGTTGKIKDSGKSASSFDAAGTASGLINTLRGGYTDTLQSVANAASAAQTTAEAREPKSTAVRHAASTAVGSASHPVYVDKDGNATACDYTIQTSVPSGAVFTDTHYTAAFTITNGSTTAQSFAQNADKSLAIKAAATGSLTASTSASTGTLTVNVGVASGYTIPSDDQITAWNKKWDPVNATTSSKGIASFNSSNFDVTNGAVSLAWAEWV